MKNAKKEIAIIGYIDKFMQKVMTIGPKKDPSWAIASIIPEQVAWIFIGKASVVKKNIMNVKARAE